MLKEIKYLIFIVVIALFIFLTGRYYFSDEHKRSHTDLIKITMTKLNYTQKIYLFWKMIHKM